MKLAQIKSSLILVVSVLFMQKATCQRDIDSSNLLKFIQQNADSSIMYFFEGFPTLVRHSYLIISKVGDRYIYSSYSDPYKQFSIERNLPKGEIARKFRQESQAFNRTDPDTNKYYLPKIVPFSKQELIWKKITTLQPWKLKDDSDTTFKTKSQCEVDDGWVAHIILITKNSYKHLFFDNPDFYEKCSPGNVNRQKAIKIADIFSDTFGDGGN